MARTVASFCENQQKPHGEEMSFVSNRLVQIILALALILALYPNTVKAHGDHEHAKVFSPEEEKAYFEALGLFSGKKQRAFPITEWNECSSPYVTGNYYGFRCARHRVISKILNRFVSHYLPQCVRYAANTLGHYDIREIHIEHKGIFADKRHSPESLHSEGRAIDVRSISYKSGWRRKYRHSHELDGYGAFFSTLRECWGQAVMKKNDCPAFEGDRFLTGSIGKEDEDHQIHLHLSVPYSINNQYMEPYFRR